MAETKFVQELVLYAASAALSCLVLFAGLRHLDPNREASKKAVQHKKDLAKRLGRPLIQTNSYEVLTPLSFSRFIYVSRFIWPCGFCCGQRQASRHIAVMSRVPFQPRRLSALAAEA